MDVEPISSSSSASNALSSDTDMQAILVPMKNGEILEVHVNDIPQDCAEIVELLVSEAATPDVWLRFALQYLKRGDHDAYVKIMNEACQMDAQQGNQSDTYTSVLLYNSLASYALQKAFESKDDAERQQYRSQALQNLRDADRIDYNPHFNWVNKGLATLLDDDWDKALHNFDTALHSKQGNTPALLGKAAVAFYKEDYITAYKLYRTVLETKSHAPPEVRYGLGLCYARLGHPAMARACFERVQQLDPSNVDSLVALAIMELNDAKDDPQAVRSAMGKLKRAYKLQPNNPLVLLRLADHFFYKKDMKRVEALAVNALNATNMAKIEAEALFQLGRAHHVLHEFDEASTYYEQAASKWPQFPLARFGNAQMHLYKDNRSRARDLLESVLTGFADNSTTLKALATLYSSDPTKQDVAILYARRVVDNKPDEHESWILLGELLESSQPDESFRAYKRAAKIMRRNGLALPSQLLNNLAILFQNQGDLEQARSMLLEALSQSLKEQQEGDDETDGDEKEAADKRKTTVLSIKYNLGRLHELLHEFGQAEAQYQAILEEEPAYIDCYLRLGSIARDRGDETSAEEWFRKPLERGLQNADSWTLLGNMCLDQGDWKGSQERFTSIHSDVDKKDQYGFLAMGNMYYDFARANTDKPKDYEKNMERALEQYVRVLKYNPHNVYAANGIGVVMAEKGYLQEAKDIFSKVRESTQAEPHLWINMAHVDLAQGNYENAITIYENCSRRFFNHTNATVLVFIAKAYYELGNLDRSLHFLYKALHLKPANLEIRFNVALVLEEIACTSLADKQATPEAIRTAEKGLKQAKAMFACVSVGVDNAPGGSKHSTELKDLKESAERHADDCGSKVGETVTRLEEVEQAAMRAKLEKELTLQRVQKLKEERERAREAEMKEAQEREREEELRALDLKNQLVEMQDKWVQAKAAAARKGKGDGGRDDEYADADAGANAPLPDDHEDEDEAKAGSNGKLSGKKRSAQEEQDLADKEALTAELFGDSDDEDDDQMVQDSQQEVVVNQKKKRKTVLEDDEE